MDSNRLASPSHFAADGHHHDAGSRASSTSSAAASYKRASRKNAPRRFICDWPGCDKIYSRSEHLQRHILNHAPREIYACDEPGCDHKFVRSDLLARHKKRHSPTYIPRTRNSSIADNIVAARAAAAAVASTTSSSPRYGSVSPVMDTTMRFVDTPHHNLSGVDLQQEQQHQHQQHMCFEQNYEQPYEQHFIHTPQSYDSPFSMPSYTTQPTSAIRSQVHIDRTHTPVSAFPAHASTGLWEGVPGHQADVPVLTIPSYGYAPTSVPNQGYSAEYLSDREGHGSTAEIRGMNPEGFAGWLFDSRRAQGGQGTWAALRRENGLDSTVDSNVHFDEDSMSGSSQDATPGVFSKADDGQLSIVRRDEVITWIRSFLQKQPTYQPLLSFLLQGTDNGDMPSLGVDVLRTFLRYFWRCVSPRMPIIHQPSFSYTTCPVALLLAMIAMGASQIDVNEMGIPTSELRALADLIITCLRWEILTAHEASPPIDLWVAQALILVELYEKMYSTRKLHERSNIYHTATITLLRRGSPLIGQASADSPSEDQQQHGNSEHAPVVDSHAAWMRWAETEAMHRVVFGAFMMDIVHAAMFGHTADMAPQEIRLPLPCDDRLWTAPHPQAFRQIDMNLKSHGTQSPVSFLLTLKNAIHGKEINTHPFGRMIIMCGLLSVGWHLRNRETHLKWLDLQASSAATREQWSRMLLRAFDGWKASFDRTLSLPDASFQAPHNGGFRWTTPGQANGLIESAALLYHLSRISLYASIVDCQVYAGVTHVLGREITSKTYASTASRLRSWALQPSTRFAVLHSFKLLRHMLLDDQPVRASSAGRGLHREHMEAQISSYMSTQDSDPHRPWIIYYATLCIWSFTQAHPSRDESGGVMASTTATTSSQHLRPPLPRSHSNTAVTTTTTSTAASTPGKQAIEYLSRVAALHDLDPDTAASSLVSEGLPQLLDLVMSSVLAGARTEILQEAYRHLAVCREILGR
ncbi:DNA binding [Microdochium nivale]|nr:DNA binding [Microdochium nivale]